jgi:hypothetical protein
VKVKQYTIGDMTVNLFESRLERFNRDRWYVTVAASNRPLCRGSKEDCLRYLDSKLSMEVS